MSGDLELRFVAVSADPFEVVLAAFLGFAARTGNARVPKAHVKGDLLPGNWVSACRGERKAGRLDAARVAVLEAVPGWSWDPAGGERLDRRILDGLVRTFSTARPAPHRARLDMTGGFETMLGMDDDELGPQPSQPRCYWSQQIGTQGRLDLATAATLVRSLVETLTGEDYFTQWAGYSCVDGDRVGLGGSDPAAYAYRKTRLRGLWPPSAGWDGWDENHLMTAVEMFFDVVAKPIDRFYHDYAHCGFHATNFNRRLGRERYREEVNQILGDLGDGFELNALGVVERRIPSGFEELAEMALPSSASGDASIVIGHAVTKFRGRGSSDQDQVDAIPNLVGLLESVRPKLKDAFHKRDEADLFEIANRFNLRHSDPTQRTDYDRSIFLPWLFYSYLAAVHAAYRLIERHEADTA